jgi:hypothetical protein
MAVGLGTAILVPMTVLATVAAPAAMAATALSGRTAAAASLNRIAAASCSPTQTKLDGGNAVNYCGPATATLVVGAKTYKFKNGTCQTIKVSSIKLDLTMGTIAEGKSGSGAPGNAKKPYFALDLSPGLFSSIVNEAFYGGKKLNTDGSVTPSGFGTKGTFTGKVAGSTTSSFSGSWNCHGSIIKH